MATKSFDEMLVIDTKEAAENFNKAYWDAVKRGPLKFEGPSIDELLERGREFLRNNPNFLKEMADAARKRAEERGEEITIPPEWDELDW